MPIVPAHEHRRRVTARQVFTGNPHTPVGLRPSGEEYLVVVGQQLIQRQIFTESDIAEKAKPGACSGFFVLLNHRFDLLMIGSYPTTHETIGSRQAIEEIDRDQELLLFEQLLNRIKPCGTSPEDRNPQ